jgi:Ca2+/H+ antiporter, TMEM165/GDT1 family
VDWTTLFSTFGLLFIAELGDKTQLAVITQVCKYRRPWQVFLGGVLALTLVTGLGVVFGRLLSALVPALLMQRIAGAAFVVMGMFIFLELIRSRRSVETGTACACDVGAEDPAEWRRFNRLAFSSTFGLLFVAELGDKTQLAVLSIASNSLSPWPVFMGATAALAAVTGLGVLFGQGLCRLIPERVLKLVSACAFIVLGVLVWCGVF